jgi:hypothetical protein
MSHVVVCILLIGFQNHMFSMLVACSLSISVYELALHYTPVLSAQGAVVPTVQHPLSKKVDRCSSSHSY